MTPSEGRLRDAMKQNITTMLAAPTKSPEPHPLATLVIITHPGAQDILTRNWPYLQVCGPPIVVEHDDKPPMTYPSPPLEVWRIGSDPGKHPLHTLGRFLDVITHWYTQEPQSRFGTDLWLVEADTILLAPPPPMNRSYGLYGTLAGHGDPVSAQMTFHGRDYFHCPWGISHDAFARFILASKRLVNVGLTERFYIDRFLGLIDSLYADLSVYMNHAWSRNEAQMQDVETIRRAIAQGAWAVHGVKTGEVLDAIIQRTK